MKLSDTQFQYFVLQALRMLIANTGKGDKLLVHTDMIEWLQDVDRAFEQLGKHDG